MTLGVAGQIQDRYLLGENPELLPTYYFIAKTHAAREKEVGCILPVLSVPFLIHCSPPPL